MSCLESTASAVSSSRPSRYGAGVIKPADALRCVGRLEGQPMTPPLPSPPPSPPSPPPTPPVPEGSFTIVSGARYCELTNGGRCVTDGAGEDYGNDERCVVRANGQLTVTASAFDVEDAPNCGYDFVKIGGTKYCGTDGPTGVTMASGSTMQWVSDSSLTAGGFTICAAQPSTSPPMPPP